MGCNKESEILVFHKQGSAFEDVVREQLNLLEGPITVDAAAHVTELDCSEGYFFSEDIDTLLKFCNLELLAIETGEEDLSFLKTFRNLKNLGLFYAGHEVDCRVFANLPKLEDLLISGGDISSMNITHTDALSCLHNLKELTFHEFGTVDLAFLEKMSQLKLFCCSYSNQVENIESIRNLTELQHLELVDPGEADWTFLANLKQLESLEITYTDPRDVYYYMNFNQIPSLTHLKEFSIGGHILADFAFLKKMPWLEELECWDARKITGIESIGELVNLRRLRLHGFSVSNLDFLDTLPDKLDLSLSFGEVKTEPNLEKLKRFSRLSIGKIQATDIGFQIQ